MDILLFVLELGVVLIAVYYVVRTVFLWYAHLSFFTWTRTLTEEERVGYANRTARMLTFMAAFLGVYLYILTGGR